MAFTFNLRPLSSASPRSFDPNIHFAIPMISGAKVEIVGDEREKLRTVISDHVDARVNSVLTIFRQASSRVSGTVRAIEDAHTKLQQAALVDYTACVEAQIDLLTFVSRIVAKLEKGLSWPFPRITSYLCGGMRQLTALQNTITSSLRVSSLAAQAEQIQRCGPYLSVMTDKDAATALKNALLEDKQVEKGFMLCMDPDKPLIFYLVEGVKKRNEKKECDIRESIITLRAGKYTLQLDPNDPQHASFEGHTEIGEKKNEWTTFTSLLSALEEKYGKAFPRASSLP